jgi:hypothetical protein
MQRTDSETLAVGEYARTLLDSATFNSLHKECTDAMLSRLVNSQPHEAKLREYEYAKLQAMGEFVQHLVDLAVQADALKQTKKNQADEDEGSFDLED